MGESGLGINITEKLLFFFLLVRLPVLQLSKIFFFTERLVYQELVHLIQII